MFTVRQSAARLLARGSRFSIERAKREPPDDDDDGVRRRLIRTSMTCAKCSTAGKRAKGVEPAQPVADIVQCGLPHTNY
jgi:hypothetical protein